MMAHSPEIIDAVMAEVKAGLDSADIIAIRAGIPVEDVEEILEEFKRVQKDVRSNVDVIRDNLKLLQSLLDTAEWAYRGEPNVDNAAAIVQMVQTSLSAIKEIEARKDPAVILNEILGRMVQPQFRDFVRYVTEVASRAREELYEATPREYHVRIDTAVKGIVAGVGRSLSTDHKRATEILASILECKPEDGKVRPLLRAVNEGNDGSEKEGTSDS